MTISTTQLRVHCQRKPSRRNRRYQKRADEKENDCFHSDTADPQVGSVVQGKPNPSLLAPQSVYWIHFRSTARWNVAGKRGDADE